MTYEETLDYLYNSIPVFQHSGASAYKPGLGTTIALDNYFGNPHRSYRTIHVAGTNGKGSTSHLLAAILQQSGFRVGLYTSPHLVDFRERIRVNGKMISKEYVIDFVERHRSFFEPLHPSFFELTSSMAFDYFAKEKVDVAIIEVGLGGRLDSTNIITPILSIITNISLDHTQFLGNTEEQIASEKAGIIKNKVPVVVGEVYQESVAKVFRDRVKEVGTTLCFAQQTDLLPNATLLDEGTWLFESKEFGTLTGELGGMVQCKNAQTVLTALHILKENYQLPITEQAVREGFARVVELTGLMGRWQTLQQEPKVVCDTGHNVGGWDYLSRQLQAAAKRHNRLWMIVGMVNDKDINGVLALMPKEANYLFTQAAITRALPSGEFAHLAAQHGLKGDCCSSVKEAVSSALAQAGKEDLIFIGGSTFIVAEAIPLFHSETNQ